MSGKSSHLKSLEKRKELLLAESESNRRELVKDFHAVKDEIRRVKKQVQAAGSIAASTAAVATAVSFFRHRPKPNKTHSGHSKLPWISAALEGARTGASLFVKIRSFFRDRA